MRDGSAPRTRRRLRSGSQARHVSPFARTRWRSYAFTLFGTNSWAIFLVPVCMCVCVAAFITVQLRFVIANPRHLDEQKLHKKKEKKTHYIFPLGICPRLRSRRNGSRNGGTSTGTDAGTLTLRRPLTMLTGEGRHSRHVPSTPGVR